MYKNREQLILDEQKLINLEKTVYSSLLLAIEFQDLSLFLYLQDIATQLKLKHDEITFTEPEGFGLRINRYISPLLLSNLTEQEIIKQIDNQVEVSRKIYNKELFLFVIVVPALNEESKIQVLFDSIKKQHNCQDIGLFVLVVDNGCTDKTVAVVHKNGGNTIKQEIPGINPARKKGLDAICNFFKDYDQNLIVVLQTDADCKLDDRLVYSLKEKYIHHPEVYASVGPTLYDLVESDKSEKLLSCGRDFVNYFNITTFSLLFELFSRSMYHFLLLSNDERAIYFPGGNTAFRLSVVNAMGGNPYSEERLWESILFSYKFQRRFPRTAIVTIPGQTITASSRAVTTNGRGNKVDHSKVSACKSKGYIPPFKDGGTLPPDETLYSVITADENFLYNIQDTEVPIGIVEGDGMLESSARIAEGKHTNGNCLTDIYYLIEEKVPLENSYQRTEHDVLLLKKIFSFYKKDQDTVITLDSGYAVEALCGGKITRYHHDMDITICTKKPNISKLNDELLEILNSNSDFVWESLPTKQGWIWLRESNPADEENPRQLNVKVLSAESLSKRDGFAKVITSKGKFIFSFQPGELNVNNGRESFWIPEINLLLAEKMRLCESYGNNLRKSDYTDISRLLKHSGFNLDSCYNNLFNFYVSVQKLSFEDAQSKVAEVMKNFKV